MKKTILLSTIGALAFSTAAFAQQAAAPVGIEEIVVTAQKREENLQSVPLSVSAITGAQLEQRGVTALGNMLNTPPPGVVVQPFAGSQALLIMDMRGVTNSDPGQGTVELGTAIYIDDVYQGRAQSIGLELADPERVEVLRGPQGTLFGRNAEGGAVRIVTKKPTGELGGNAKFGIGNYGQRRYEGHLNLPEFAGFSVKLDYVNTDRDGYTKNGPRADRIARQRAFGEYGAEGYRASVRWQPTDTLTFDYAYDHSRTEETYDYNVLVPIPAGACPNRAACAPLATMAGARPLTDSVSDRTDHSWTPLYNAPYITKGSGHTLLGELELNDDITLRSITSFRKVHSRGGNQLGGAFSLSRLNNPDRPTGLPIQALVPGLGTSSLGLPATTRVYGISGVVSYSDVDQSQRSQEFQLVGNSGDLEWVVGAYYFREKVQDFRQSFLSIVYTDPGFTNAIGTNPFTVGSATSGQNQQSAKSRSYAGFGQATWSPSFADDRLHLTAGIRYTDDKKSFLRTINAGAPSNWVGEPFSEKRFDPAFTIAYDVTDDINAYARYAQAYRSGGVSVRSPLFAPFGAEVNKSWEAGLKSDLLDRRLRINLAVFENRIHNRQITVQLDPTGNPSVTDTLNAPGVTRIRGAELEITAAPTPGLLLGINYGYLNGKRPPSYMTIDPEADVRIQSLPKHSITTSVDYITPELSFGRLAFHFDYSLASDTPGTGRVRYDAFAWDIRRNVANGRISLQDIPAGPANLKVALFGKNLFDTAYPVFTAPGSNAILSPPRTYGVEVGVNF